MLMKHVLIPLFVGIAFCGVLVVFGKPRAPSELIYMVPIGVLLGAMGFVLVRERYVRLGSSHLPAQREPKRPQQEENVV